MDENQILEEAAECKRNGQYERYAEMTQELMRLDMAPAEITRRVDEINHPSQDQLLRNTAVRLHPIGAFCI